MTEKSNSKTTDTQKDPKPDVAKTKSRVIPQVPKSERIALNEGYEPKSDSSKKELND